MLRRLVLVASFVVCSFPGCKKDKADPAQGTSAAGQQGTTNPGAEVPSKGPPPKKAPEGCNSDLSQRIEVDFTFTEKCSPYTVSGDFNVDTWTLTIEPGVEVRLADGAAVYVGYSGRGRLVVKGTAEKPVKFTSAGRKEPGAWKTLQLYENAEGSVLENTVIEFAGTSDTPALRVQAGDVTLKGVSFVSVKGTALTLDTEKPAKELSGLDLSKAGGDLETLVNLHITSAGVLGSGNVFPDKAVITLSGNVNRDVKLSAQGPVYRLPNELSIEAPEGKSAVLTVQAGVTMQMSEGAAVYVGYANPGGLKVLGTKEKPVVFTRFGEDPKASPWKGFIFYGNAHAPEFDFAVIEYAGRPNEEALKYPDPRGLGRFTNSIVRHCAGTAIKVESPKARFEAFDGNVFEDVKGAALDTRLSFAHALGANNKLGGSAVVLRDSTNEDTTLTALDGPYWLQGEVAVDGEQGKTATLTLQPGVTVRALEGAALNIGYSGAAKLVAKGGADKGITFEAVQGAWKGVHVYGLGAVDLENVTFSGVEDDSNPLVLDIDSKGSIKGVTLKGTKKGVRSCGKATVAGVKADKGVKAEEKCE